MTIASWRGSASAIENVLVFHALNGLFEQLDPLPVACRERLAGRGIGLCQLPGQRVVGGSALVSDLPEVAHVQIDPPLEVVERPQATELGLTVKVQHHLHLAADHGAHQCLFVGEVVGQLGSAHRGGLADVHHAQRRQAIGEDHLGRRLHDPLAGGPSLRRQRLVVGLIGWGHGVRLPAAPPDCGIAGPFL